MGKSAWSREEGAIMLEGMMVMVITLFVLIWILGLGFLYYQRYVTTIVTNDAAAKIAATYNNASSDIVMGYIDTEALTSRDLYRLFPDGGQKRINKDRAEAYIRYILDRANFVGVVQDVNVELELVMDSLTRRHVQITTTCTYNTPFGEGLELMGMRKVNTYEVSACADCTDYADYISTVDFGFALTQGDFTSGIINSGISLIKSMVKYYNRLTD